MQEIKPKNEWSDDVFLSDECKERFLTSSDIPEMKSNQIFMAGLAELATEYRVERVSVPIHTLLFTLEGRGLLITENFVKEIEPFSLTVLPANMPYRFELHPESKQWKMIWLLLNPVDRWEQFNEMGQCIVPFHACEQIWSLFNLLHIEIGGRKAYRHLLLSEIMRVLTGFEQKQTNSTIRVQTLFNEIESQLHLNWTIKEIAQRCFISEEQLNRICKSLYEMSPKRKLIHLRMDKATHLLRYELWSIAMIAPQLGYKDPYNFTHRFRKHFGCSPREYRKMFQE